MQKIKFRLETPQGLGFDDSPAFELPALISPDWSRSDHRILVVIEYVDTEDLKAKQLLAGPGGYALDNGFKLAERYLEPFGVRKYSLAFINFNYFKSYHLSDELQDVANKEAAKRVRAFIKKIQPHKVLVVGDTAAQTLIPNDNVTLCRGWPTKDDKLNVTWFNTISLHKAYSKKFGSQDTDDEDENETQMDHANLLGYVSRNIAACLHGDLPYKIKVKPHPILINTIRKWKKLYGALRRRKVWAYDTETENLNRTTDNRILTMQFAFNPKKAYIVPLYHKDSTFTTKEIDIIKKDCHDLWSKYYDPLDTSYEEYTIGQNLKFDFAINRLNFGVYQIKRRCWDLMAGEYALDENVKTLKKYGTPQYNLLQIALNYGCDAYLTSKFSKDDRATLKDRKLKGSVLKYVAYDVQIPFAIHNVELERAQNTLTMKRVGQAPSISYGPIYKRLVLTQINNIVHIDSIMESRGIAMDIEWLHKLKSREGPLQVVISDLRKKLFSSKAAKKANANLLEASGIPQGSLYGDNHSAWILKLSKPEHKIELLINVLGLEPLKQGKSGAPSIDKAFLDKYKDVPEVALFSELSALEKLMSTYVTPWLKRLKINVDFRYTLRLNPSFGFNEVVTGRGNSFDPNLQNIPERGKYAKLIKRAFATVQGRLKWKMDYSAHEVRMWSVTAGDLVLGMLFTKGRDLRRKFRETEDVKYKELMLTVGDIHVQNVSFFFSIPMEKIKPVLDKVKNKLALPEKIEDIRYAVKALVFGAIYGRSAGSIANVVKKTKDYIQDLLKKFFKRFPKASGWLEDAKKGAVKYNVAVSPIGRRRNMFGHLFGIDSLAAGVERRGANAPIQGIASDTGHTAAYLFGFYFEAFCEKFGYTHLMHQWEMQNKTADIGNIEVMVHDSISGDFPYALWLPALQIMQWCATIGVMIYYHTHFGIKFTTCLEVEFALGAHDSALGKWDWSEKQLRQLVNQAVTDHIEIIPALKDDKKAFKRITKEVFSTWDDPKVRKYLDSKFPILPDVSNEPFMMKE